MTFDFRLSPPKHSRVARGALRTAAFAAIVTFYAAVMLRTGAIDASSGLPAMLVGLGLAGLAALLGLAALVVVWRTGRTGGARATFALVISAMVLGGPAYVAGKNFRAPRIHDVSTDLVDPPRFERAAGDRAPTDLPLPPAAIPPDQANAQKAFYPDVATLRLQLAPDEVANLAAGLVEDRGWRILGPIAFPRGGGPTGRIEAVARTAVLGLAEDVSVRVRSDEAGSRVDMRSASRVGGGDFGSNAERIRKFLADLASAANAAP